MGLTLTEASTAFLLHFFPTMQLCALIKHYFQKFKFFCSTFILTLTKQVKIQRQTGNKVLQGIQAVHTFWIPFYLFSTLQDSVNLFMPSLSPEDFRFILQHHFLDGKAIPLTFIVFFATVTQCFHADIWIRCTDKDTCCGR